MTISTIIYARSSADCPASAEQQIECLQAAAAEHGWIVARVFTDRPMPLGRSLNELVGLLEMCRTAGVELYVHDRSLDTAASHAVTLFEITSMMMQHLHQSRRDRILRGQAAARLANVRFGRPPLPATKIQKAQRELASGKGVRAVARSAGISAASVSRLKNSMSAAEIDA